MNLLTFKLNTYIATLLVTIFGGFASLLIIHIAQSSERLAENGQLLYTGGEIDLVK